MSKSEDLKKTLTSANTGRKELDELARYVGQKLEANASPHDVAYYIADTIIAMSHGEKEPDLPTVRSYVTSEDKCLELGASMLPFFQQHAPRFAEKYAESSRIFFGNRNA